MTTSSRPRKAAPIAMPVLTSPVSRGAAKADKIALAGHEQTAARCRQVSQEMDALDVELRTLKAELIAAAKPVRLEAEVDGRFAKTVALASADGRPVDVTFGDRYRDVDVEHEEGLRGALGKHYDTCLRREARIRARGALTVEALKEALGDRFEAFSALVDVSEVLTVADGFAATRAALRSTLRPALNTAIDTVMDFAQIPSVKTK